MGPTAYGNTIGRPKLNYNGAIQRHQNLKQIWIRRARIRGLLCYMLTAYDLMLTVAAHIAPLFIVHFL